MNINEIRSGNLVSYKGYPCEVRFVDTFRNHVCIDLDQYVNNEIFKEQLMDSRVAYSNYVNVSVFDLSPINIDEGLVKKLKIDNRIVCEYLSDRIGYDKVVSVVKIRWDESCDFDTMQNVFIIDIDGIEVGSKLEPKTDYNGTRFEMPNIRYIHQVQNIYFALTGKEL
jgi:hypothetical protein